MPDFDINEGAGGVGKVMLPSAASAAMSAGMPGMVGDVEGYAAIFETQLARSMDAGDATAKGIAVPPGMLSFGKISYMPESYNSGVLQWPGVAPEALRKIVRENLAPQLIIGMRCDDVIRFSQYSTHPGKPGWRIEPMNSEAALSISDKRDIKDVIRFLSNSSIDTTYSEANERDGRKLTNFQRFLSAMTRDTLTFDGIAVWKDVDQKGKVKAYSLLPAGNIRLVGPDGYLGNTNIAYVAVDEGNKIIHEFTREELTFYIRNPRPDAESLGYGYAEVEIAMRLVQGIQNAIDLNCDTFSRNCLSEDTEVLTKTGWKLFKDVEVNDDYFATMNTETGVLEYQQASAKVWSQYDGELYSLKSRAMDFLVTPEHRVLTQYIPASRRRGVSPRVIYRASDLYDKIKGMTKLSRQNYGLPLVSSWGGTEIGEKTFACLQAVRGLSRTISGDDYCAFMGMYLSEGSLSRGNRPHGTKHVIIIHQDRGSKGFNPFWGLWARILGRNPTYAETLCAGGKVQGKFSVGWRGMAEHLALFGADCYDKYIPQEILDATPRQQKIFWDFYCLGDGHIKPRKSEVSGNGGSQEHIATTSRVMADQLQELAQKMGYAATIRAVDAAKYIGTPLPDGRVIKSAVVRYDVYLKTSKINAVDMEKVPYSGMVGCVTVPNGTLYVRRNGKAAWTGNSTPNGILVLSGSSVTQRQLDLLNRMWTNLKKGITKAWALPVMGLADGSKLEVVDMTRLKGNEVYYRDFLNMFFGAFATVYRFPVKRIGYKISGQGRDNEPNQDASTEMDDSDDPGLAPLLIHIENVINEYLVWTRWPHLRFTFIGKNPKEEMRGFEFRKNAMTFGEARSLGDLDDLENEAKGEDEKLIARIMNMAPLDPNMSGVFQSVAAALIAAKFGAKPKGGDKGNTMTSKIDPARSEDHGGTSGVRRNSAAETKKE